MDCNIKHCIINATVGGGWYPAGQKRLERSLLYHGSTADHLFFNDQWLSAGYDQNCNYNIKAATLEYAINLGYKRIIWNDASQWYINNPMKLWDVVNDKGYFFWRSGYNCAQTCSDRCLEYYGVTRDTAEHYEDCSSSCIGLNLDNPDAIQFARLWIKSAKDGVFSGSRLHDNQSEDPRFMFHRQDQSAASMIIGLLGLKFHDPNDIVAYYDANTDQTNFTLLMRGM
jgi:hypothetical protein